MASTRTLYTPAEVTAYSEHGKWYFKVIDAFGGALLDGGPFLSRTTALTVGKQEMAAMKAVKKNAGKKRTPKYAVSPQVLAALRLYQSLNGPQWKAELRDLWMRGHDVGLLRQARNQIGPGELAGIDAALDTAGVAALTADQIESVQRVSRRKNAGKLSGRKRNPGTYYVLVYTKAGKHIETFGPYKLASAKSFARIGSQTGGPRQIRRGPRGRVVREYQGGERTYPKNTAQERGLTKAEKPKGAARPTKRSRGMRKAKLPRRNAGGYMHLVPAYGRDYKSAKAVKADWDAGKDFRINDMFDPDDGRLVNKEQVPHGVTIQIRYKKMTQLCVIKPGAKAERVVSALAKNTSKAEQVVGAMAGGWRKKKITVPMQSGESVELPAEVMGVWAVHRRAGHRGRASARVACTITHVPTGLAVLTVYDDPRTVIPRTRAKRFVETLVERNPDLLNEHDKDAIAKRVQAFKDVRSMLRMNPGKAAKGRGGQKLLPLAGPQRRNAGRLSGRKRNTASKASKVMGALSGKAAKGADPLKLTQKERTKVNKELHAAGLKYYSTKFDLRIAVEDALSKAELVAEWPSDFGPVYADSGKQHHVEVAREWYGTLRNTTLTVNVYRMPSGNYELTAHLS